MTDKIIFWLDGFLLNFGLAYNLQKKHDCELYSIIDITNRTKKFFEEQNLVNFQKIWFLHDHIQKNKKIDIDYLKNFEKKYSINLWQLAINERIFYQHNDFYEFSHDEILSILEKECKLYELILDDVQPDFLITSEIALHQQHLFSEICRHRGIKVLILYQSKISNKCIISQKFQKLDFMPELSQISSKKRSFDELLNVIKHTDDTKPLKLYEKNFGGTKLSKLKAGSEYFLKSNNSNIKTHFSYYGRNKSKVLINYVSQSLEAKKRKLFIDKNLEYEIYNNEKFILFTLHQEPEKTLLIEAPFYTNQLEVIRHIAKSLPIGYRLYVKEHFSQALRAWRKISYYKEIIKIPNVRLYHPSSNIEKLIQNSSLVISISGTVSLEAAFFQKPSIMIADMGFLVLPSIQKLTLLEELPMMIRKGLDMKVNSDDLDRYVTILDENSFDFDLPSYMTKELNFFSFDGNFLDTIITDRKMKSFLDQNDSLFTILADNHISKFEKLKQNKI